MVSAKAQLSRNEATALCVESDRAALVFCGSLKLIFFFFCEQIAQLIRMVSAFLGAPLFGAKIEVRINLPNMAKSSKSGYYIHAVFFVCIESRATELHSAGEKRRSML